MGVIETSANSSITCFVGEPTEEQFKILKYSNYGLLAVYLLLLILAIHNTYAYMYKQKRYKVFLLSAFYTCSYFVIITRMLSFWGFILYYNKSNQCSALFGNTMDSVSTYTKLILGFFQCTNMIELVLRIRMMQKSLTERIYLVPESQHELNQTLESNIK